MRDKEREREKKMKVTWLGSVVAHARRKESA